MSVYIQRRGLLWYTIRAISTVIRLAWRYVSGAPLDGERRTDASWLLPAENLLNGARSTWWNCLPRLYRAGIRLGATAVALATLYGLSVAPTLTQGVWAAVAVALIAYGIRIAYVKYQLKEHRATYIIPMGTTVGPLIGHEETAKPERIERWLSMPLDFFSSDQRPELKMHLLATQSYDDKLKTMVLKLIADKLGRSLDDLDYQWQGKGAAPTITIRLAPKPPAKVLFADMRKAMENASEAAPIMGIAARGKMITSNFDSDAPHVAASAGSGAGKSVWGRLLIAQGLRNGIQYVVLDKKRVSQNWCKNHPGVIYCVEGKTMHNALIDLAAELKLRFDLIDSAVDPDNIDVGPRIVLFFEEQNMGMKELKKYWESIREKGDPKRSPAIDALDELLCAGRQAKMHVISIAQLFTVQAAGGDPTARENYATRFMARATQNAWKMLAPECAPFPKMQRKTGRWYVAADGVATEFQVGFLSEAEALEWAGGGHVTVPAQWISGSEQSQSTVTGQSVTEAGPRLYSLREAVSESLVGALTYDGLRQAKSRDKANFPAGVMVGNREKWTAEQLTVWHESRELLRSAGPENGEDQ